MPKTKSARNNKFSPFIPRKLHKSSLRMFSLPTDRADTKLIHLVFLSFVVSKWMTFETNLFLSHQLVFCKEMTVVRTELNMYEYDWHWTYPFHFLSYMISKYDHCNYKIIKLMNYNKTHTVHVYVMHHTNLICGIWMMIF